MEWIIAGAVSWLFGSLGYFIVVTILAVLFPRTMQVFIYGFFGPAMWGGATIVAYLIGAIIGFLPSGEAGFKIAALLTFVPMALWTHSIAQGVATVNPGR